MLDAALRCQRVSFAFSSLLSVLSASVDFVTAGTSILLEEFALDRNPARFGLLVTLPIIFCISVVGHTFPFMTPNPLIFLSVLLLAAHWKFVAHVRLCLALV